ncbi:histone-lysine N-methyltransferase SETDB1-A isoform X1 [Astyanax mexicanus]|uniref:histone-lysine N-methyltransferase SETDB1-A isoform X1 n=1 Tax=Astyanax mexicanus TaxID=7994 RepID=UPI0020CB519B|nr:histone-lysine N-methyltransferase SETDB1-A isoform X1 [Astyanax mexicanus]XP_022538726.2 histone-lysine N-methyltransferase SETDB1-A isoform X1 [Astyanax mexicanus]XP_022538727.2 histone-lysine N-methyltransferase SETDB1-A isoform X1 [Astyanax mexicanus]XP_022538729.2 histone-lysine N-methyltransferase SETDB1-A isoform X1 [Astyanax mexicanus]
MNEEEDGELNMTNEELRRWVQSEVEKDEVLVQRRTQLAQVEEWVKQKEIHATYTRTLYNSACESVLECESVIKGVYGMLGLEYQDTDSEEEEGAKPKQNVIQIPEDPKRESEDVSADAEDDYVVIDLGAAVPDTTLEKKPTAEELLASLQMSSELSRSSLPCVKTRESPVFICSPLPHDDTSSTSFRPVSLPTKCERSPSRSPEPSDNLLSTIKTRESPVPISSPLSHDDTSSTSFRPISLPTKSERSPSRSPEPSNGLLTIKTRESPVPISSPPPSDMAPASFASQVLPIKTENSPSRSPDLSSSLLSTIKTRESPVPISSGQPSVDLFSEAFNPLSLPTKREHSTPRSPKTSNKSLPNTTNRESPAFINRVPSPDVSSSPDTTRGPSPMSYASETPPLATPTALESDAENHETIVNETPVSAKQSSETPQAHPKAVSSSTSSKLLATSTADETTAIVTISASKPVNSDTSSTTVRSASTTSSSASPGTTTRSASKPSNIVSPGITTRSVSKPSNSKSPGATTKTADKPSNSVTTSKTVKSADKPSNSVTTSKTAKPADKPSNSVTSSKTVKPADKPSNSVTSSTATKPADKPSNSVTTSKTAKPADKPSNSVTSSKTVKPADKPSNSVTSSTTTKPADKPSNSVTSSTTTKPADKPSNSVTSSTTTNSTPAAKASSSATTVSRPASSTTASTKSSETKEGTETLNIPVQKEVEVKIDMEVLARRRTKTWHKATVLDIKETDSGHRYKVKFEGDKGKSMLSGHHLACVNPPLLKDLFVGSRVVATYKEKDQSWMHAAVITEMPDRKNRMRFMVFFDDGHSTYVSLPDLRLVCKTMKNVFEDIEDEMCRTEVVEYLKAYPNPIFVVVRVGQESKVERDGEWEDCTINQVDGSLVEICYTNDKKKEWLYKGSNRLDHIQRIKTRMAEQKPETPTIKVVNTTNQNTTTTTSSKAAAATTSTTTSSTTATTSSKVTTKSVASTSAPPSVSKASSASSSALMAMAKSASIKRQPKIVLERITFPMSLSSSTFTVSKTSLPTEPSPSNRGTKRPAPADIYQSTPLPVAGPWLKYVPHRCSPTCLDQVRPAQKNQHRGQNPLLIPLLHGFRRMTARRRLDGKMSFHVYYRAPCGQSMCEMEEVQDYLCESRCDFLFLEMFCLDPFVLVKRALLPSSMSSRPHLFLPDFSEGKELVPVSCVNETDATRPPPLNYTRHIVCAPGVAINTSLDFMVGCDCTDGCRDRTRCSCHQLTVDATSLFTGGPVDVNAGYTHKRLTRYVPTGVYECNPLCRCDPWMCSNRLVQHGQQLRLQLFMTQHKGWGIRCMDDLSKGTFVCIFTGKIVTETMASSDAVQAGNEYLANLDYIEEVEKLKEGYESEAFCSETEEERDKKTIRRMTTVSSKKHALPTLDCSSDDESTVEKLKKVSAGTLKNTKRDDSEDESDQSDFSEDLDEDEDYQVSRDEVKFSDGDCQRSYITRRNAKILKSHEKSPKDSYPALPPSISAEQTEVSSSMAKQMRKEGPGESATGFAKKSTRNFAVKSSHRKVKQQEVPVETPPTKKAALCKRNTRSLFSNEKACYLIDAKHDGNMGRYINHSCSPNLFVQNVFVDTHDLRFPWVAFFTSKRIRAGTELTWDYGYEVGSVEGKVVLCCCGSSECTGRLL